VTFLRAALVCAAPATLGNRRNVDEWLNRPRPVDVSVGIRHEVDG
jgi:hypothetical protein